MLIIVGIFFATALKDRHDIAVLAEGEVGHSRADTALRVMLFKKLVVGIPKWPICILRIRECNSRPADRQLIICSDMS